MGIEFGDAIISSQNLLGSIKPSNMLVPSVRAYSPVSIHVCRICRARKTIELPIQITLITGCNEQAAITILECLFDTLAEVVLPVASHAFAFMGLHILISPCAPGCHFFKSISYDRLPKTRARPVAGSGLTAPPPGSPNRAQADPHSESKAHLLQAKKFGCQHMEVTTLQSYIACHLLG